MDRNEFVSVLRAALTGELPPAEVEDQVRYYQDYISREIALGRSEREVLEELGEPRLIARTILDARRQQDGYQETYYAQEEPEREKGFHAELNDEGGVDIKYRCFHFNSWYAKLLLVVILILILVIIGKLLSWLLPIVIPVLLIFWILRLLFGGR